MAAVAAPSAGVSGVPHQVLLSGYYGYANVGDDALCQALCDGLLSAGFEQVLIPCGDPALLPTAPQVVPLPRFGWRAMWQALRRGAVLFSGGGGLLQNATSNRSLAYYLAVTALARWAGRRYVLGFQSIGPLHGRGWRAVVKRAALGAAAVGLRDRLSAHTMSQLGVPDNQLVVAADAAFLLALPSAQQVAAAAAELPPEPRLALCLRPTAHSQRVLAAVTEWARGGGWAGSWLLQACGPGDHELGQRLAAELPGPVLALPPATPVHTAARLAACHTLITERLHPLVFAAQVGLPTAAIDYDPKVRGLAADLGLPLAGTDERLAADGLRGALAELAARADEPERLRALAEDQRRLAGAEVARLVAALSA